MDEPLSTPTDSRIDADAAPPAPVAPEPPRRSFKRRHWGKLTLAALLGVPAFSLAVWTTVALNWSYSSGVRGGMVQKISRKGWLCKTWEGTLYTGVGVGFRSDSFLFTVRNDSLAHVLEAMTGKKVTTHYEEHPGVPSSCFGDTRFFVTGVDLVKD